MAGYVVECTLRLLETYGRRRTPLRCRGRLFANDHYDVIYRLAPSGTSAPNREPTEVLQCPAPPRSSLYPTTYRFGLSATNLRSAIAVRSREAHFGHTGSAIAVLLQFVGDVGVQN